MPHLSSGLVTINGDLNRDRRPDIGLDGLYLYSQATGQTGYGLEVRSGGNVIRGLAMTWFRSGVALIGPAATRNVVAGCFLGQTLNGAWGEYWANSEAGLTISGGASDNTIGGTSPADRNVISGNVGYGVYVSAGAGNLVAGNYVGVDASGAQALPNGGGVAVVAAERCRIGTGTPGGGNVISGNRTPPQGTATAADGEGVNIVRGSGHVVAGNLIGPDATGLQAIGNESVGCRIFNATDVKVGGTAPAARNVISGNSFVRPGSQAGARQSRGRARPKDNYTVTHSWGVSGLACRGLAVLGNYVGVDVSGNAPLANGQKSDRSYFDCGGIVLSTCVGSIIGGTTPAERNVIAANWGSSIRFDGGQNGRIWGNYIGLSADGKLPLGDEYGVAISQNAAAICVGGPGGKRNVIADEGFWAIADATSLSHDTTIQNNLIGTDPTGTIPMPIRWGWVAIYTQGQDVVVGGPGAGNRIYCAAGQAGILQLEGTLRSVQDNTVLLVPLEQGTGGSGITLNQADTSSPLVAGNTVRRFARGLDLGGQSAPTVTGNHFEGCDCAVYIGLQAHPCLGNVGDMDAQNDGGNRFIRSTQLAVDNESSFAIQGENNNWGTADAAAIAALIFDGRDWPGLGLVDFRPLARQRTAPAPAGIGLTGLAAAPAGSGAEIVCALAAPATLDIELLNLAGRLTAALPPQDGQAGLNRVLWDGRTSRGLRAPSGTYLARVRARASSGAEASGVTTLTLRR